MLLFTFQNAFCELMECLFLQLLCASRICTASVWSMIWVSIRVTIEILKVSASCLQKTNLGPTPNNLIVYFMYKLTSFLMHILWYISRSRRQLYPDAKTIVFSPGVESFRRLPRTCYEYLTVHWDKQDLSLSNVLTAINWVKIVKAGKQVNLFNVITIRSVLRNACRLQPFSYIALKFSHREGWWLNTSERIFDAWVGNITIRDNNKKCYIFTWFPPC